MNPANQKHEIPDEVKINILIKEYETLRTEILQRINQRFAFIGLSGAAAGYAFLKAGGQTYVIILILVMSISILAGLWFYYGRVIHRCSSRLSEIEQQINSLVGDKLLVWETRRRSSFFHRVHY